ncbi:MAG: hypothetical protein ACOCUI_01185 [bacterium]
MSKSKCENPELMPKDGKCSKELIEKCHGKEKDHPCHKDSK